jgi:ribosomal protein L2|tara:strand:- start:628 stop:981 length:354 start_codon:yes stop_codon:yes gene_type:complete|mmetsp:Transcript_15153/g.13297  ORF Transcript_15153/g.13297 Transcript_15153/m.13297 type:complete len:118 (-) Transcript_15153:30-383(-)
MYFSNLKNLLPGTELFNLNGKYGKSGGNSCLLIGFTKEKKALIKLPSEKLIIISKDSFCQTGSVQKPFLSGDLKRCKKTKAGDSIHFGLKPRVTGMTKNPVDHPNGGSSPNKVHKTR